MHALVCKLHCFVRKPSKFTGQPRVNFGGLMLQFVFWTFQWGWREGIVYISPREGIFATLRKNQESRKKPEGKWDRKAISNHSRRMLKCRSEELGLNVQLDSTKLCSTAKRLHAGLWKTQCFIRPGHLKPFPPQKMDPSFNSQQNRSPENEPSVNIGTRI